MASAKVRSIDGRICVVIDKRDDGGGRRIDSRHRTPEAAERARARAEQALESGVYGNPKTTVGEIVDKWLDSPEVAQLNERTSERYRQIARDYLKPGLGTVRVRGLTGTTVDNWIAADAKRAKLSEASKRQHYAVLHRALSWAVTKGHIGYNPADRANKPTVTHHEMRFLEMDEGRRMLAELAVTYNGDREANRTGARITSGGPSVLYVPVLLALATGMRRSEALRLTWANIDMTGGRITIEKSKTKSGVRGVTLPAWALPPLRAARNRQAEALLKLGIRLNDSHPVCPGPDMGARGKSLNVNSLSSLFRRWADRHGYKGVRYHDLRHTQVGWLIAKGVHPKVIQERLGHSSYSFTMDRYGHLLAGLEAQAAEQLEDITAAATD